MPLKKRLLIGLAIGAVCGVAAFLIIRRSSELLTYQGKSVKIWSLQLYASPNQSARDEAVAAFKSMGSNAVPVLIKLLAAKERPLSKNIWSHASGIPLKTRRIILQQVAPPNAAVIRAAAARALSVMGVDAKSAIPALDENLKGGDREVCWETAKTLA